MRCCELLCAAVLVCSWSPSAALDACPALAAQVGEPGSLNISEFRLYLDPEDLPGLDVLQFNSEVTTLDLISNGEVSSLFTSASSVEQLASLYPTLVLAGDLSPIPIHMQLASSASHQLFYLFNVWSVNTKIAPAGCPTKAGHLSPGDDIVNELHLSCEAGSGGNVVMQGCLTLGTAPFDTLNGTYQTLEFYFVRNCEVESSAMCNVTALEFFTPGQLCITLNQTRALINNPLGSWGLLLAAFSLNRDDTRGYCIIDYEVTDEGNAGLVNFVTNPDLQSAFPISETFTQLEMYIGLTPDTEAVSFSVEFSAVDMSVLAPPSVVPTSQGVVYTETEIALLLPCLQPGVSEVPALVNMSSVMNNTLYFQSYAYSMYRDCTPETNATMQSRPDNTPEDSLRIRLVAGLVPGLLFLLISTAVIMVMVLLTRRMRQKTYTISRELEASEGLSGNNAYLLKAVVSPFSFLKEYDMEYNYPSLEVVGELGEGAFGRVFKARAPGLQRGDFIPEFVAIKTLKDDTLTDAFCKEVKSVIQFDHPNIIRLLAVCSESSQKCMIFEFMDLGGLDDLLRKSDPDNESVDPTEREKSVLITPADFLSCSLQIAEGLAYLAGQRYVHRDIAARNCLVDHNLVMKIGDFGLSREVNSMDYYRVGGTQADLPVRWMPPDALLFGKFTTQSDVWSFGILMWEVYTFGHQPYKGLSNHEVIDAVKSSKVLECPRLCPASMYDIMKGCWTRSPAKRPNMKTILGRLKRLRRPGNKSGEGGTALTAEEESIAGCVSYVNMEYGAEVEAEELEENEKVAKEINEQSIETVSPTEENEKVAKEINEQSIETVSPTEENEKVAKEINEQSIETVSPNEKVAKEINEQSIETVSPTEENEKVVKEINEQSIETVSPTEENEKVVKEINEQSIETVSPTEETDDTTETTNEASELIPPENS